MNAIVPSKPENAISAFSSKDNFEMSQRIAQALAASSLVPASYRGKENLPNVLIALELASRIGASPMAVMQNLHIIQGKPSWSSSFLIATANACGRFEPLRFEIVGDDPSHDDYKVRAYAADKLSGERCDGPWVNWPMVKAEGWLSKTGSKWKTMPQIMFMYRAAAFWSRLFAPEISLGISTSEEVSDVFGGPVSHAALSERPDLDAIIAGEARPDPPAMIEGEATEVKDGEA